MYTINVIIELALYVGAFFGIASIGAILKA